VVLDRVLRGDDQKRLPRQWVEERPSIVTCPGIHRFQQGGTESLGWLRLISSASRTLAKTGAALELELLLAGRVR